MRTPKSAAIAKRDPRYGAGVTASPTVEMCAALLTVALGIVVYIPALSNGFVWDDPLVLVQLRAMHGLGDLIVMPPQIPRFYYRPLIFVSYLVDRALGGETPFWFHGSVVAVHSLNCLLVFHLAKKLFRADVAVATISGALFAVLPTHVESVAWMAGRSDVVVCTFLLSTALLAMKRDVPWSGWLAGLTLFLALLSKELAVAGLLLIPALDWLDARQLYWNRYVPLVLATMIYLVLRHGSVGSVVGGVAADASVAALLINLSRAMGFYLVLSIVPFGVSPLIAALPTTALYPIAALAIAVACGAALYRYWPQSRWPFAFLATWFVVTLAPSLAVILRTSVSAPLADRYLYVPSVATCVLVAAGITFAGRRWRLAMPIYVAVVLPLILGLGIATAMSTHVWADNLSFWSKAALDNPQNAMAARELGTALLANGRLDDAERFFKTALALSSSDTERAQTYNQLGLVYRRREQFNDAATAFQSGLAIASHPMLFHNLGLTLMAKAELDQRRGDKAAVAVDVRQARDALESALKTPAGQNTLEWDPAKTHALLGQVLIALNERSAAREHLETALRLQPTGPAADVTRSQLRQINP